MTWLFNKYRNMTMYVGTSDTESTLNFYYRLGFEDYDIRKISLLANMNSLFMTMENCSKT